MESRSGGVSGNHTLVFRFPNALASYGAAAVTAGSGSVVTSAIGDDPRQFTIELTGVANAQLTTVSLTNVTDSLGNNRASLQVTIGVLIGDTNGDGFVNAGDALQTRSRSGQTTGAANFRSDVNTDGTVNSGDTIAVRARSGTSLP